MGGHLTLSRAMLDGVQTSFHAGGLSVRFCEFYSHLVTIPKRAAVNCSLSRMMIAGYEVILMPQ